MKKILFTIAIMALTTIGVRAQQSFMSVNYNPGFLVGDASDFISNASWRGWGIDGRFFVSDQVSVGGYVGFNGFYEKTPRTTYVSEDQNTAINAITWRYIYNVPVYFNAHYYFNDYGVRPYAGIGIGTMFTTQELQFSTYSIEERKWSFSLAPEIGVLFDLGDGDWGLILSGKYNYSTYNEFDASNMRYINLNIGFAFHNF